MQFVLDNSITMRWLFGDGSPSDQSYVKQVLAVISDGNVNVWVPSIWCLEVTNVIVKAESKNGLSEARSSQFIYILQQLHIQIDQGTCIYAMNAILHLARSHKLSTYDAAYLELSLRKGIPLATLDKELEKAIQKSGGKKYSF